MLFYHHRWTLAIKSRRTVQIRTKERARNEDVPVQEPYPEARRGQWGEGLTATEMQKCRWLKAPLAESTAGRNDRLPGTDRRESPAAFKVRGIRRIIHAPGRADYAPIQDRPVTRVTSIRFFHIFLPWSLL